MIRDDQLRILKRAVTVELALVGRAAVRARVFVPTGAAGASTRAAVVDLLEQEHAFLPTQAEDDPTPQIFNKDTLVWVAITSGTTEENEEEALFEYHHEVRVELVGGEVVAGELFYSLPDDHARVADYLNAPGRFFRVWTSGRLFLINKAFVERVVETPLDLDHAPDPGVGGEE